MEKYTNLNQEHEIQYFQDMGEPSSIWVLFLSTNKGRSPFEPPDPLPTIKTVKWKLGSVKRWKHPQMMLSSSFRIFMEGPPQFHSNSSCPDRTSKFWSKHSFLHCFEPIKPTGSSIPNINSRLELWEQIKTPQFRLCQVDHLEWRPESFYL